MPRSTYEVTQELLDNPKVNPRIGCDCFIHHALKPHFGDEVSVGYHIVQLDCEEEKLYVLQGLRDWQLQGLRDWQLQGLRDWQLQAFISNPVEPITIFIDDDTQTIGIVGEDDV